MCHRFNTFGHSSLVARLLLELTLGHPSLYPFHPKSLVFIRFYRRLEANWIFGFIMIASSHVRRHLTAIWGIHSNIARSSVTLTALIMSLGSLSWITWLGPLFFNAWELPLFYCVNSSVLEICLGQFVLWGCIPPAIYCCLSFFRLPRFPYYLIGHTSQIFLSTLVTIIWGEG